MRVAALVVACVALLTACGSEPEPAPPSAAEAPAPAPAPKLDGSYRLTFDPATRLNGVVEPPTPLPDADWTLRSACGANGCVATSADPAQAIRVFDDVDGAWTFVAVQPDGWRCPGDQGPGTETWTTWRISSAQDGGLTGTVTDIGADACPGVRERTFALATGGQPVDVPDPALEPARVVSPAEGLRGRYIWSNTRPDDPNMPPAAVGYGVATPCLRTGERCISSFTGQPTQPDGRFPAVALNFVDGAWTQLTTGATLSCGAGGQATGTRSYAFPLPAPPVGDPIEKLTGEVRAAFTAGDCPKDFVFTTNLTRTGD